jgi:hypothetical protein
MNPIVSCPHCETAVMPSADGICPACRGNVFQRPEAPASTAAEPVESTPAEEQYHVFRDNSAPGRAERPANAPESIALAVARDALADFTPRVVVTPAIVAINVAVFLAMALAGVNPLAPEVLAPWRALRQQVEAAEKAPLANPPVIRKLSEYMRVREASFQSLVEALPTNDPEKMCIHREQWDAADRLAREFGSDGP